MKVLRWTRLARVTHWLMFVGVTIGFITGLPTLLGAEFKWIYDLLGGEAVREFLHYYVTILILGPAIPLTIARAFQAREAEWWWPSWRDIRDAMTVAFRWIGLTKKYPQIGFHHPLEKIYLLAVHVGLLLLGVSGILMVFDVLGTRYEATLLLIHDFGFILTGLPLAAHFFLSINPVNWEALRAIFTDGKVSVKWAKKHHPAWPVETQVERENQ
ncbi:MAG: cytochrome b/b6 domain-containing protein [Candidatus Caldarchaeum sp.]|nr:cytochrome b/b6 domain-containing protein [Candidatus Caldarchaeum sp.]